MTNYPKPLRLEEQVGDKTISFETGAIAKSEPRSAATSINRQAMTILPHNMLA